MPNKVNTPNAIQGESNLISLVYESRALPNFIQKQLLDEKENNELIDLDDIINKKKRRIDLFTILNIDNAQDESASSQLTPSSLLANSEWVRNVFKCFTETRSNEEEIVNVSQEQIEQSENLRKILRYRLTCHIFN